MGGLCHPRSTKPINAILSFGKVAFFGYGSNPIQVSRNILVLNIKITDRLPKRGNCCEWHEALFVFRRFCNGEGDAPCQRYDMRVKNIDMFIHGNSNSIMNYKCQSTKKIYTCFHDICALETNIEYHQNTSQIKCLFLNFRIHMFWSPPSWIEW